jgi:hypothetical protein
MADTLGNTAGERLSDRCADVVACNDRLPPAQLVEERDEIADMGVQTVLLVAAGPLTALLAGT